MVRLAIAGGNIAGSTVMSMLRGDPDIHIVGIYEKNIGTPGAVLAQKWGIPVFKEIPVLAETAKPEIVINVTGDTRLGEEIKVVSGRIEIIDAAGARLLWKAVEKHKKALIELSRVADDERRILSVAEAGCRAEGLREFAEMVLEKAAEVTDTPAGSIAMAEGEEMRLIASRGLSKRFIENGRWKIMPGGLTDNVIKGKKITAINNISEVDYINNSALPREGIAAVLACPLVVNERVRGILYLDDFKPRHFSERQKRAVTLIALLATLIFEVLQSPAGAGQGERLQGNGNGRNGKLKERVEELERTNRDLQRGSLHKSRFIANMSHELRTPLNSILGFSDILMEKNVGELTDDQERYIRNIHSAGRHLLELVNNVLDIAKIEAGKYELSYETFSPTDIITEIINVMKPVAGKKSVSLVIESGDTVRPVTADRVKLKQVLYNLVSNAIKFTPEGGEVRVAASIEAGKGGADDHGSARFSVTDTGIGIGPEDIDRIFDEFEQAGSAFAKRYGGTGLGLTLTRKLVELHGGQIRVESKPGRGSSFVVSIPLGSPPEDGQHGELEAVKFDLPWTNADAPLILVVEDDTSSAELLTLHLTQAGYKVAHAFDGEEAVRKAEALRPFAILLDIMLPKKDGWEVLQSFKSNEVLSNVPVLIHSVVDNKDLAFALGATDYLLKPLDRDTLLDKIQGLNTVKGRRCPATILVIDHDGDIASLKGSPDQEELLVYSAREGRRGIELAMALRPDVILLDFELPDMIGFDVVRELKENPSTRNVPIFILTERDIPVEARISLMGKIERILKKHKFDAAELIGHIMEMEVLYPKRAGLVDDLTGVFSHRYFQIRLAQEVERARRYRQSLNLMLLDVDFFGHYLRENGEHNGNEVLKKISELLTKNIRGSDVVVRYGGDAFAIILPNTVLSAALSLGNRFNAIIRNYPFPSGEKQSGKRVTVSVGLAFLDGQMPEDLILCSEKALAHAIRKGGDRVEIYSSEWEEAVEPQT